MSRRAKLLVACGVLLAVTVLAAGCGGGGSTGGGKGKIPVGLATALTGEYTIVGQYLRDGAQMAVDEINASGGINGQQIEFFREDSANTNTAAVNAYNKLIDQYHVCAIIGPDLSPQHFAVKPIVEKKHVVVFGEGTNAKLTDNYPWYIRMRPSDAIAAEAAAKFAVENLKKTKVGVTHDTDEFGVGGKDIIVQTLQKLGATVVGVEGYNSQDKDLSAQLTSLKNKGAEVIIDWGHPAQSATIQRQNKQLGINLPIVLSPGAAMPATINLAGGATDGNYAIVDGIPTQSTDPRVQEWCKKYRDKFHMDPDFHASAAYDAVYLLKAAIEKANSTKPEDIQKALMDIKDFKGIANTFSFSGNGDGAHQVVVAQFKGMEPKVIATIQVK